MTIQLHPLRLTVHPKINLPHTRSGSMDLEGNYVAELEAQSGVFKLYKADAAWNVIDRNRFARVGITINDLGQALIS